MILKKATFVVGVVLTLAIAMTLGQGVRDASAFAPYVIQGTYFTLNYNANNGWYQCIAARLYARHAAVSFDSAFVVALQVLQSTPTSFTNANRLVANLYWEASTTLGYYAPSNKQIYLNTKVWKADDEVGSVRKLAMVFSHEGSHAAFYRRIGFVYPNYKSSETTLRFLTESLAWYTHSCRFNSDYTYTKLRDSMRFFYSRIYLDAASYGCPGWGAVWQGYGNEKSPYAAISRTYFVAFGWWLNATGRVGALLNQLTTEYANYNGTSLTSTYKNPYDGTTYLRYSSTVTSRAFLRTFGVYANEAYDLHTIETMWSLNSTGTTRTVKWKWYLPTVYTQFLSCYRSLPVPISYPSSYTGPDYRIQPL